MLAIRILHLFKHSKHVTIDNLSGVRSSPVLGDIYIGYIFIENVLSKRKKNRKFYCTP